MKNVLKPLNKKESGRYEILINKKPGVYCIEMQQDQSFYVGSSVDVAARLTKHFYKLNKGKHENKTLQEKYDKDPNLNLYVRITKDREEAYDIEQKLIDAAIGNPKMLNIGVVDVRNPCKGVKRSEEYIDKMRNRLTGKKHSEESKKLISTALKGVPKPIGFGEKLSEANKNHPRREELNKALSEKRMSGDNPNAKQVIVDGVVYGSGSEAARTLNISRSVFSRMLTNDNFPNIKYLTGTKKE